MVLTAIDDVTLNGIIASQLPGWSVVKNGEKRSLRMRFIFPGDHNEGYILAAAFYAACVPFSVAANHHAKWSGVYNFWIVELNTHDAGEKVTQTDIDLAKEFVGVYKRLLRT